MTFFFLRRLVGGLVQPAPIILFCMVAAFFLLWNGGRTRRRFGLAFLFCALGLFGMTVFPYAGRYVAGVLEAERAPILDAGHLPEAPALIVVLGNGVEYPGDSAMPALSRLNNISRARLVEGVRLAHMFPDARLATCGNGLGLENCADAMAEAAMELGIDAARIIRLTSSRDTVEEAKAAAELGIGGVVAAVTSAVHMERTLCAFRDEGMNVIAAPCDFSAPLSDETRAVVNRHRWQPRGTNLVTHEKTWHELLGLLYLKVIGSGADAAP